MEPIYCMKCKKKTNTRDVVKKVLGNKIQIKGLCAVCKTKKSTFTKK